MKRIFKYLFLFFISVEFLYGQVEKIKVGSIDPHFSTILSKEILKSLLKNIEQELESQVGANLFDISNDGKPVNIVFVNRSNRKIAIERNLSNSKKLQEKLENIQNILPQLEEEIVVKQSEVEFLNQNINTKIEKLNNYIENENQKQHTQEEYEKISNFVKDEQQNIKKEKNFYQQKLMKYKGLVGQYNQKITNYNMIVRNYNRIRREIENLSKSFKETKGAAIGYIETTLKTIYKDGKFQREKTITSSMDRIEIYGFENLQELKVILAHEIGHLIGVAHIDTKGALMNPVL